MIKVTKQFDNKFTINCYLYDNLAHNNDAFYSMENIPYLDLARSLQGRIVDDAIDDVLMVVLNTNRPAFVSDLGKVTAVSA